MGLGPSIKMTTLHHYDCPVTRRMLDDPDVDFIGVIENGVSENFDAKVATAVKTGEMASKMKIDGAVVAIDGWGNHHIDFINVIEQLGLHDIPSVGLSYIGLQGRLVATNQYVETVVDFNKESSGYETCKVGQNNLTDIDAYKAIGILKHKVRSSFPFRQSIEGREGEEYTAARLIREYYPIRDVAFGKKTEISDGVLTLKSSIASKWLRKEPRIRDVQVRFIRPEDPKDFFINSNLDFMPIARKVSGKLGSGKTLQLSGIKVMLNGVEENSGFQPANIGSSEGILKERVEFDQAGTPKSTDFILHLDFLFKEGEGRTAEGIMAAHTIADRIVQEIRDAMEDLEPTEKEIFTVTARPKKMRLVLVKIASGLGNMYDTSLFPDQPGGFVGSYMTRDHNNDPVFLSPTQVLDGVIHSLI